MSHSPEPWIYTKRDGKGSWVQDGIRVCDVSFEESIAASDGALVVGSRLADGEPSIISEKAHICRENTHFPSADDARRIVACVNACAGASNEKLQQAARHKAIVCLGNSAELRKAMESAEDGEIIPVEENQ